MQIHWQLILYMHFFGLMQPTFVNGTCPGKSWGKEFWKLNYICRNYDEKSSVLFFWGTVYALHAGMRPDNTHEDSDSTNPRIYTVSKKQYTWLMIITSADLDQFAKLFHWQIPKETPCNYRLNRHHGSSSEHCCIVLQIL